MKLTTRSIKHAMLGLALVGTTAVGLGAARTPATARAFDGIFTGVVSLASITAYNASPNYPFCTWDEIANEAQCPIVFSGIAGASFTHGGTVRVTVRDVNRNRTWTQDIQAAGGSFLLNFDPLAQWELLSWCPPFNSDHNQTTVLGPSIYTIEAQDLSSGFTARTNAFKVCGPDAGPI